MNYMDGYAHDSRVSGLSGEIAARIADFLSRKSRQVPDQIEALRQIIEEKVLNDGVKEGLLSIVRKFKWEVKNSGKRTSDLSDSEWKVLVMRIEMYGRTTSIENYSEFLFSMEEFPRLDSL